jgi:hypothetical protein
MGVSWATSAPRLTVVAGLAGLLAGCFGYPQVDSPTALAPGVSPERAAAVAEMRAEAAAGDTMRYPKVYRMDRTLALAARPEPRSTSEVDELKAELSTIAAARAVATDPNEIASLDQRAADLRLLIDRQNNGLRR